MALPAGTHLGPYEILAPLGAGGMGEVYRARDPRLKREVALKVLPAELASEPERLERFEREAQTLAALNHPHIVTIHSVEEADNLHFLTMELVEGKTLTKVIPRGGLPLSRFLHIAIPLTEAVSAAHEKGITHRDLKPGNVMVTEEDRIKVLDFGLAKLRYEAEAIEDSEAPTVPATGAGRVLGTAPYMSPEQVRGQVVDHRSDIFSLGTVLYEMLSGQRPFRGETPADTLSAMLTQDPPELSGAAPATPPSLERIVRRCLEKRVQDRFHSAHDLALALEAVSGASPPALVAASRQVRLPFAESEQAEPEWPAIVARELELARLEGLLAAAMAGRGRAGFVVGEAGSGKTALVGEFCRRAQASHAELVVASGYCSAHTGVGDPYLPFREVLGQLTGDIEARWAARSISRDHALRLWSLLPAAVQTLVEKGPDLVETFVAGGPLLTRGEVHAPGGAPWLDALSRVVQRKLAAAGAQPFPQAGLFAQYGRVLQGLAREQPLLLTLDDLQWADAGSLGLLFHLGRQIETSRILILGLYRGTEVAEGRGGERHPLEPVVNEVKQVFGDVEVELGRGEDPAFVEAVVDREPNRLSPAFRDALFQQTRGQALFTVELLRGLQEQGRLVRDAEGRWLEAPGLSWDALPVRVEAAIAERIGRLPPRLQRVLELASLEGEEFTAEIVARLEGSEAREMIALLSEKLERRHRLVRAQGIERVDGQRLSRYRFGHILFQRYLDQRWDAVERAQRHEEAGRALEEVYGERAEEIAVELARHYEEAGLAEKAVEYLHKAGERAKQAAALEEAIVHYRRALELLGTFAETSEREKQEAELQIALGWVLIGTQGFASAEAAQAFARARELCMRREPSAELFWASTGLVMVHNFRAEHGPHRRLGEQTLELAHTLNDPTALAWAHEGVGDSFAVRGDWRAALAHYEEGLAIHDAERDRTSAQVTLLEHAVTLRAAASTLSWALGWPDKALRQSQKAIQEAEALSLPGTLAFVLAYDMCLLTLRGEVQAALDQAERLEALATEWGLTWYGTLVIPFKGWCLAQQGRSEEATSLIQAWLPRCRAAGVLVWRAFCNTVGADACLKAGATQEALELLEDARAVAEKTGERQWEAELLRGRAEMLLSLGEEHHADAEHLLRQAVEVARRQETRSLELRAVTGLSRLLRRQGRKDEARSTLAEIYGWFTEGFDTQDLKDAKALLEELSGQAQGSEADPT